VPRPNINNFEIKWKKIKLCDFDLGDCDVTLAWEDLKDAPIYNYVDVSYYTLNVTTH
jgi:hypothetical protein